MRIVIIEDEPLAAQRLQILLEEYDPSTEVLAILQSVEEAVEYFRTKVPPDLLFLDIELGDGACFQIFSRADIRCPVVFTTAYNQYAIEAFRVFSIDYLLKPITLEDIARAIQKFRHIKPAGGISEEIRPLLQQWRQAEKNYRSRFLVKTGNRMFFVDATQVAYFLSEGKAVFLVTREGQRYPLDLTLERLQEELDPRDFFRLNRSTICSIHAIREIRTHVNSRLKISLKAGQQSEEAIVSRDRVPAFRSWAEA